MLPIRTRSVFKSRWMALLWSAGILWSVAEFVGSPPAAAPTTNTIVASENHAADAQPDADQPDAAQIAAAKAALDRLGAIH